MNLNLRLNFTTIIGGGLMGSAAAWHLSKNGESVLLLEQQGEQYTYGSSFGERRISRSLGGEDDIFSYLHNTAVEETQKLIDFLNTNDVETHRMTDIYTTSPVTYIYDKTLQNDVNELLFEGQKDSYVCASSKDEAWEKFGMRISNSDIIIREYKKHSGTLNPSVLISKLHTGIRKHENTILYHRKVLAVHKKNSHYEIEIIDTETKEKTLILTKKIVVAAGGYTGDLLRNIAPHFEQIISPRRVLLSFFKINKKSYESYTSLQKTRLTDTFPIFDLTGDQFYSMIEKIDTDGLPIFKTGGHRLYNPISNLDEAWKIQPNKSEIQWAKNKLFNYLITNNLSLKKDDIEYFEGYSCVYSMTKTHIPVVCNMITKNGETDLQSVIVGGMSGIGAKGAMCYGLIAANLLINKDNTDTMYQKTQKALGLKRLL